MEGMPCWIMYTPQCNEGLVDEILFKLACYVYHPIRFDNPPIRFDNISINVNEMLVLESEKVLFGY